jgi:hypothetical protein
MVAGQKLWVADLRDVAEGKRRAKRPKDQAALYVIESTIKEAARRTRAGQGG